MKLYDWNLCALGLTLGSWLIAHVYYKYLPSFGWFGGMALLTYALSYPALGWAALRSIWSAVQGKTTWYMSLQVIGVTFVQFSLTMYAFLLLVAEAYINPVK
ncbi:hypothetical protein ACFSUS_27180 [Spirosoma soli]|uniref:Uncharacterized protein n=1 Tax=Spirosoma soli TaxID=1770529 RepID=A0ABW5MDJ3_9BACT